MEYSTLFWIAQAGHNALGLGWVLITTAFVLFVAYGIVRAEAFGDYDREMPFTLRHVFLTFAAGLVIAFSGGMIPNKDTIIFAAAAEHGIDYAERLISILENQ